MGEQAKKEVYKDRRLSARVNSPTKDLLECLKDVTRMSEGDVLTRALHLLAADLGVKVPISDTITVKVDSK